MSIFRVSSVWSSGSGFISELRHGQSFVRTRDSFQVSGVSVGGRTRGPAFSVKFRFGIRFRWANSVQGLGQGAKFGLRVQGSVQGSGKVAGLRLFEFGFGVCSRAGGKWSYVQSGVQVRGSVQGSGLEFDLEFGFGVRFRVRSGVRVQDSVQGSGPEFSLSFRLGVWFRVRVRVPVGVRNANSGKWPLDTSLFLSLCPALSLSRKRIANGTSELTIWNGGLQAQAEGQTSRKDCEKTSPARPFNQPLLKIWHL